MNASSSFRGRTVGRTAFAVIVFASFGFRVVAQTTQPRVTNNGYPAVSPDGKRIAFVSDRDGVDNIFLIDADGTREHRLTTRGGNKPDWAPDGRTLLYAGVAADTGHVFSVAVGGGDARVVANVAGRSPRLSPDGQHVAYVSGPWTSTALNVARPDGSDSRRIDGGGATAWNPAWSPDSKRIAYTYGDSSRLLQVHIVAADGVGDVAVTHTSRADGSAQVPAWSPDGNRLALQVNDLAAGVAHIWVIDLATGQAHKLAAHEGKIIDEVPAWFPDGRRIAFMSNRSGRSEVWVMNADGTNLRQLTGTSNR